MNPPLLRHTLGISAILMITLIVYRKNAIGISTPENNGKLLTVTAATRISGIHPFPPVLVKGLLRKNQQSGDIFLVDEDSVSTNPKLFSCRFTGNEDYNPGGLPENTELVIEGYPGPLDLQEGLNNCRIISINNGTVYTDPFPEH